RPASIRPARPGERPRPGRSAGRGVLAAGAVGGRRAAAPGGGGRRDLESIFCRAGVAHLVERTLPKVEVAGSRPVARSNSASLRGEPVGRCNTRLSFASMLILPVAIAVGALGLLARGRRSVVLHLAVA